MTTFYIVRHAEIQRTAGDPGITERGRAQANLVGAYLKRWKIAGVSSSPLIRARQTAELLAEQLHVPLVIDELLRERINWGDVPGQTWEDFAIEWNKGDADPDYSAPGGFSARTAAGRMAQYIDQIARQFPQQSYVLVSHGGIIGDFVAHCFSAEEILRYQPDWRELHSDVIDYASVTVVRQTKRTRKLLRFAARIG